MKSPWEELDEIARVYGAASTIEQQGMISRIATLTRNLIERVGLREETAEASTVETPVEGQEYEITLRVKARCVDVSNSHGLSFQFDLESRDFLGGRTIYIDANEIVGVEIDGDAARSGVKYG